MRAVHGEDPLGCLQEGVVIAFRLGVAALDIPDHLIEVTATAILD
ncbi:hypothetical protein [Nocardia sp. NPDC051463]